MLPNVRLMIAATLASIVALICGFGMFAAFRVSHEPLGRLPSAAPSLQFAAQAATTTMPVTAAEPFAHRFRIGETADADGASALAYAAPQPATPIADEHEAAPASTQTANAAAPPEQVPDTPATTEMPAAEIAVASAPGSTAATPSVQETAAAESRAGPAIASAQQDETSSVTSEPDDEALEFAAVESLTNPPLPVERRTAEAEPKAASEAHAAGDEAKKKRKRRHFVRIRRLYRATGFTQNSAFSSSFGQYNSQTASQYNFQPAGQYKFQTAPVPKPRPGAAADSSLATAGPFVSAPSR
jgi:hypothetical protein